MLSEPGGPSATIFRMRSLSWLGLLLMGCAPPVGVVARLDAPGGVSTFRHAQLETFWAREQGGGGHGFGPSQYEMAAVGLQVDDQSPIVLWSHFGPAPMFWEPKPMRALVKSRFALAASPDGRWLGVSRDDGQTWRLVSVGGGLTCPHLELAGPEATLWARAPSPQHLVEEVLRSNAGLEGPLGLDHGFLDEGWHLHPAPLEALDAARLALRFTGEPAVQAAAFDALEHLPDGDAGPLRGALSAFVRQRAETDPLARARVGAWLTAGTLAGAGLAATALDVLGEGPETTSSGAQWASRAAADSTAVLTAFKDAETAWRVATLWWSLARAAFRQGAVPPELRAAAHAWLQLLSSTMRPAQKESYDPTPDPWTLGSPQSTIATYAIDVLGLAGDTAFLSSLPQATREPPQAPWPPTFEGGAVEDARVGDRGNRFTSVSAWLKAAQSH